MLNEIVDFTVLVTAVFNFIMLVFLYKRDEHSQFSWVVSCAALLIAAGQLSYIIKYFYGSLTCDYLQSAMQIGLAIVIGLSRGSVKTAGKKTITHAIISDKVEAHKRAA